MTEQPLVLVINCGSSSLKFAVHALDRHRPLLSGLADRLGLEGATISFKDQSGKTVHDLKEPTHAAALEAVLEELAARSRRSNHDQAQAAGIAARSGPAHIRARKGARKEEMTRKLVMPRQGQLMCRGLGRSEMSTWQ